TEFVLVHFGGGDQLRAFGERQFAGDLRLVALLEILDCRQHRVAAGGLAGIVARPQQRGLDFQALVRRNSREHVGRPFCSGGWGVWGGRVSAWPALRRRSSRRRASPWWALQWQASQRQVWAGPLSLRWGLLRAASPGAAWR